MPSPSEVRTPLSTSPRFSALSASLSRRQRTSYCSAVSDSCSDFLIACSKFSRSRLQVVSMFVPQGTHAGYLKAERGELSRTLGSCCVTLHLQSLLSCSTPKIVAGHSKTKYSEAYQAHLL